MVGITFLGAGCARLLFTTASALCLDAALLGGNEHCHLLQYGGGEAYVDVSWSCWHEEEVRLVVLSPLLQKAALVDQGAHSGLALKPKESRRSGLLQSAPISDLFYIYYN